MGLCLLSSACLRNDPDHCAHRGGDAACAEIGGGALCSSCTAQNHGCVDTIEDAACHRADGGDDAGTTATTTATMSSGSDSGTTGPAPSCTSMGEDPTCPDDEPYCIDGTCSGCAAGGEGYCAGLGGKAGVCHEGWGQCVECLSDDDCGDEFCHEDFTCGGCFKHSQCPDSACDIVAGECMDSAMQYWVDSTECNTQTQGFGTQNDPYCTLADAFSSIPSEGRGIVHVSGGPYEEPIQVTAQRVVAVLTEGLVVVANVQYGLDVETSSHVYVSGLRIRNTTTAAANCYLSATLYLDGVTIDSNEADGIAADNNCKVFVRRSKIYDNVGNAAVFTDGGKLTMQSSMVVGNGNTGDTIRALRIDGAKVDVRYSTIVGNITQAGYNPANVWCSSGSTGSITDSVIVGPTPNSINCPFITYDHDFVDTAGLEGEGVVVMEDFDGTWFKSFDAFNIHVADPATSPFADVASWDLGDPWHDLDNDTIPHVPGRATFAGADQP